MSAYFEIWGRRGPQLAPLEFDHVTVGRSAENTVSLPWDRTVSTLHAVVERYASGWSVRDLGSTNGTFVNNVRLSAEHRLRNGDEVRFGSCRVVFRLPSALQPGASKI